jgi:hypothetical protein
VTKRYDDEIEVTPDPADAHAPLRFRWRGRRYEIDQRIGSWREAGGWWSPEDLSDREYHRVLARPAGVLATGELDPDGGAISAGAVYDVYRDRVAGIWKLARIWD